MGVLKLCSCRTLHPPWRTIHVHEIYMMILAPLPKNGRPCSQTWHCSTEDVPWVLPPKFITQWSPICKVEWGSYTYGLIWPDMYQQLLNKKGPFLLVTFCPQKQAMDLVHRKCFVGEKKWVRTMNGWLVPFNSFQHFNAHRQAQLSSQEQRTESELLAPLRSQACFSCRMPSPAPGTTKLSQEPDFKANSRLNPNQLG